MALAVITDSLCKRSVDLAGDFSMLGQQKGRKNSVLSEQNEGSAAKKLV